MKKVLKVIGIIFCGLGLIVYIAMAIKADSSIRPVLIFMAALMGFFLFLLLRKRKPKTPVLIEPVMDQNSADTNLRTEPQQKKRRGCLAPVLIVVLVFIVFLAFGIFTMFQNPEDYQEKSVLASELDLTTEQENSMLEIFAQCGIGEITSASKFQSGDGHTSYHLDDAETAHYWGVNNTIVVWVDDESKIIESIHFHEQDIYVNGEVLGQITDYYVNSLDRERYRAYSQTAVNQILNYPDTAEYPAKSGWRFGIEEGVVIAQSSVIAKNAFGVESTHKFQVKYINKTITSLILDETEYIN